MENTREVGYQKVLWLFNGDSQLGLFASYKFYIRNFKKEELKWSIAISSRVKYGKLYFRLKNSSYLTKTSAHL